MEYKHLYIVINTIPLEYHLTLDRMAIFKKSTNNKCWRGCGEKETPLHCWWECKLVQPLWRIMWRFLKKKKKKKTGNRTAIQPSNTTIPLLGIYPRKPELKDRMYPNVLCSTIVNSQDMKST